jgi:hypothetical protein
MESLAVLLEKINTDSPIPHIKLNDINKALDHRDKETFAGKWMELFQEVEIKKESGEDADDRVTQLREATYLQAYDRWHSPELAAYISDDFGLIGDALAIGFKHPWLTALLHAYMNRKFPMGTE